ncbi:MAG: 4Fe-4S dicluster domain-containing protein, partial [Rhodoplanes sp.]
VEDQGLEVLKPELGTKPRVYYRNLWRYAKCFIGGTISTEIDGVVECVEGARVRLLKDGVWLNDVRSDAFGDFRFDRLAANSGGLTLEIEVEGKPTRVVEARLGDSINLGEIRV